MSIFLIFFLVVRFAHGLETGSCGVLDKTKTTRFIVGSEEKHVPWVCSVGFFSTRRYWQHRCTGVAISLRHILTAAHCLEAFESQRRKRKMRIRCGDSDISIKNYEETLLYLCGRVYTPAQ